MWEQILFAFIADLVLGGWVIARVAASGYAAEREIDDQKK